MTGYGGKSVVLEEQQALVAYLDGLLREVAVEPLPPAAETRPPPEAPEMAAPIAAPAPEIQERSAPVSQEAIIPEWGEMPFHCLLFRVGGLKLAVPLVKLNGVIPWPGHVSPMPGHRPWNLGVLQHLDRSVKIVDTARILMPEDRLPAPPAVPGQIVFIDGYRWGLACDGVDEVVTLDPGAVRWRTARTRRPWLAGTVIQHMCAILDPDALSATLSSGDWEKDRDGEEGRGSRGRDPLR